MSTNYQGDARIPARTSPSPVAISSSTGATPPVVTTSSSHGYATGDCIFIEGHDQAVCNGLQQITVLTSNTFSLIGVTGTGAGTAKGQCVDQTVNPIWQLPSGGDTRNASSVNVPLEASANLGQFLSTQIGRYQLIDYKQHADGSAFTTFSTTALNSSTWVDLGVTVQTGSRYLLANDLLVMSFFSSVSASASSACAFTFAINFNGTGAQEQPQFAQDFLPGTSGIVIGQTLNAAYLYAGGGPAVPYAVSIVGKSNSATPNLILSGAQQLTVMHYRPNF